MTDDIFHNRVLNAEKLLNYGFKSNDNGYFYSVFLMEKQFEMFVYIEKTGEVSAKIIECSTNEEYTLYKIQGAEGIFVGKIREEYENVLLDIAQKCFDKEIFKNEVAKAIIAYIKKKYQDELEFLWEKLPLCAISRRKDNKKWYLAIITLSKRKLGFDNDELVEIIDLRGEPEWISRNVNDTYNKKYLAGYHMNKKYWFTIILDGTVKLDEIFERIDTSYQLAKKK